MELLGWIGLEVSSQVSGFIEGKTESKGGQVIYHKSGLNNFHKFNLFFSRADISFAPINLNIPATSNLNNLSELC